MVSIGVIYASEALAGRIVTITDGIFVHIAITFAFLARPDRSKLAHGIPKVAILTFLTTEAHSAFWAFCTFGTLDVA